MDWGVGPVGVTVGCGGDDEAFPEFVAASCVPGVQQECACEGVYQECKEDGSGFTPCACLGVDEEDGEVIFDEEDGEAISDEEDGEAISNEEGGEAISNEEGGEATEEEGSETPECPPNALCTCKPGFEGDGEICIDIDECENGTDNCGWNEVCVNNDGSYECVPGPCGNGIVEGAEECDDGNNIDGDGCSSECIKDVCQALSWESGQNSTADIMSYGGAWTIEGWFRVNSLPSSPIDGGLISIPANDLPCTSNSQYWYINTWSNGALTAGLYGGDHYSDTTTGTQVNLGQWTHMALQYHDDGTGSFYVNGNLVTMFSGVVAGWNEDCPLYIGTSVGSIEHPSHADLSSLHFTKHQKYTASFVPNNVIASDPDTAWLFDFSSLDPSDPGTVKSLVGTASIGIGDMKLIEQCAE